MIGEGYLAYNIKPKIFVTHENIFKNKVIPPLICKYQLIFLLSHSLHLKAIFTIVRALQTLISHYHMNS